MDIKLNKKYKAENRIQFRYLPVGNWFEFMENVYIKIRAHNESDNVLNLSKESIIQTFVLGDCLCKMIEAELTYWEKE